METSMNWVIVDNNCGTGAGGFKPGNSCARGRFNSKEDMAEQLGLPAPSSADEYWDREVTQKGSASELRAKVAAELEKRGFIRKYSSRTSVGDAIEYEHPTDGHEVFVSARHPYVSYNATPAQIAETPYDLRYKIVYVPPILQEGVRLAQNVITDIEGRIEKLVEVGQRDRDRGPETRYRRGYWREIIYSVEEAKRRIAKNDPKHALKAVDRVLNKVPRGKAAGEIKTSMSVLRDWIMDQPGVNNQWQPTGNNCGTGAGGFKPGNDCAKGSGPKYTSLKGLTKDTDLGNTRLAPNVEKLAARKTGEFRQMVRAFSSLQLNDTIDVMDQVLRNAGFKQNRGYGMGVDVVMSARPEEYTHPEGHTASLHGIRFPENSTWGQPEHVRVYYIVQFANPKHREGSLVSDDAVVASEELYGNPNISGRELRQLRQAVDRLRDLKGTAKYKELRKAHEDVIRWHQDQLDSIEGASHLKTTADRHRKAIGSHGIARDYYMDKLGVQNQWEII